MQKLIIWGAGTLGGRVGRLWSAGPVIGATASESRHASLQADGIQPHLGSPQDLITPQDGLLLALPGHKGQSEALQALQNTSPPQRAVLISSTGYYGQASGPVDEHTAPGSSERAQAIAALERNFLAWAGSKGVVLRFGGLYCAGRGPFSAFQRKKVPPQKDPAAILPLIHYDDAAQATLAALQHPNPHVVYLALTLPSPSRAEFYQAACQKLGWASPKLGPASQLTPAEYHIERLRQDLLASPTYPHWQAALA